LAQPGEPRADPPRAALPWYRGGCGGSDRGDNAVYNVGEKPGVGHYCCTNCRWRVRLDDASDRLPPCGSCGKGQNTQYTRC